MVYSIKLLPEAYDDLKGIQLFYDNQAPNLGHYCTDLLFSEFERLRYFAGFHGQIKGFYRMLVQRFPLSIYYRLIGDTEIVVAILDNRQDPKRHINRLS
ncbi:MAG: hypothetical protein COW74_05330 [Piscirickettsiaceae bacterium CG18_big_fil_WC_8_21_14_2_50_44_103]|nr:MAG: hypothetical protein COW74_05330 [Piscirickettsiaceae bacterium CG18_big_fil_WC_8_21_14_2_50_44_103]